MSLSKVDRKVLEFVLENGSQLKETEVARQLRLKPSTVSYILKKMRRERTILRYRYRLNYHRIGFPALAWVLFKFKTGPIHREKVLEELLAYPQVHVASFVTGSTDIAVKLIEQDVVSMNNFVLHLTTKLKELINSPEVLFATKTYKTHNVLLQETEPYKKLDQLDFDILSCKMLDPDTELKDIAKKLKVHRNTISKRWRNLWKENVLMKKTPVVNPEIYPELGISLKAIMFIDVESDQLTKVTNKLLKMHEIHELNRMLSGHDLMAIVRVKNVADFYNFWTKFADSPAVKHTLSRLMLFSIPHKPNYLAEMSKLGMLPFKPCCQEASEK